jgi:rhamnogalacturonyl hydrolase YesR
MYMAPPFIAYFAADSKNASLLKTAYLQCGLYRQVLLFGSSASTFSAPGTSVTKGLWHHIVGPQSPEPGLWSTGNGWAAAGMTRVLATVMKAPIAVGTSWRATAITDLTAWIKEIVDGARAAPMTGGLLRNYLNDTTTGNGFGEISGSSLIAAVAYRMVVLAPQAFPTKTYVPWADSIRKVLGSKDASGKPHITSNGTATPAVNPLAWLDTKPWTAGRYSYSLWLDV